MFLLSSWINLLAHGTNIWVSTVKCWECRDEQKIVLPVEQERTDAKQALCTPSFGGADCGRGHAQSGCGKYNEEIKQGEKEVAVGQLREGRGGSAEERPEQSE